jgi:hypothetical protein
VHPYLHDFGCVKQGPPYGDCHVCGHFSLQRWTLNQGYEERRARKQPGCHDSHYLKGLHEGDKPFGTLDNEEANQLIEDVIGSRALLAPLLHCERVEGRD